MRTLSADQSAVLSGHGRSEHMRVKVRDAGGTLRTLTTYPGINLVESAAWSENVDEPHAVADFIFKREIERLSLAPLMTESALNLGFDPSANDEPLLGLGREIRIETAIVPADILAWLGTGRRPGLAGLIP